MSEVVFLTGTEEARGWLQLARSAETLDDVAALLSLHSAAMRRRRVAADAGSLNPSVGHFAVQRGRSAARS
jgi:hypothetical protein